LTDLNTDVEAAHQLFASLDGMEGLPGPVASRPPLPRVRRWIATIQAVYPGALAAGVVGLAATWLSQHYTAPVMLFALLLGMAFHFLHEERRTAPGIEFTSKRVLRLGVALLGARITVAQITDLGVMPIATVVVGVASTIGLGVLCSKWLGLSRRFGVLTGGSVAICGASAALAIGSVLPRSRESERDTILTVVVVTALSTLAMILYPMIATALRLDHVRAGIFLGGTIHDVAQVAGAGYTISPQTGDIATYVKLLRVTLLLPVVFTIALFMARSGSGAVGRTRAPVPWFLFGFAALVAANSLGLISKPVGEAASVLSRACLVTAISALGMKTSFGELAKAGWRPLALMVIETLWIGALVLGAIMLWA
jgi:uncharacterized integral membrane protein (TIGR00698 family)